MQPDITCDFISVSTSVKLQVAAGALSLLTNCSRILKIVVGIEEIHIFDILCSVLE